MYKKILFTIAIFAIINSPGISSAKSANEYLKTGIQFFEKGKLKEAENNYKIAIKLNPKMAVAYSKLGNVYLERKNFKQAIYYYQKAIKIDPKFSDAYNNLGSAYGNQGDNLTSEKYFLKALSLNPKNETAKENVAYLQEKIAADYFEKNNYKQAIFYYQKLLKQYPDSPEYYARIGLCNLQDKKFQEGLKNIKKALIIDPDSSTANSAMGFYYIGQIANITKPENNLSMMKEKLELAHQSFEKACNMEDSDSCEQLESIEKMKKDLKILQVKNNPDGIKQLILSGKAHFEKKEYGEAIEDLKIVLEADPENHDAKVGLRDSLRDYGVKQLKLGNKEEGKNQLKESAALSLTLKENQSAILVLKAIQYNEEQQFEKTIEILNYIKDGDPLFNEKDSIMIKAYIGLSMNNVKDKKYAQAQQYLEKAKDISDKMKDESEENFMAKRIIDRGLELVMVSNSLKYQEEGKLEEAGIELSKLIKMYPDSALGNSSLGYLKYKQGKFDEAVTLMNKSVSLEPENGLTYYNLACVYSLNKNTDLALKNLKISIKYMPPMKEKAKGDEDFNNIKELKEFKNLVSD